MFDNYLFSAASKGSDVKSDFHVTDLIFNNKKVVGVEGKFSNGETKKYYGNVILGADGPYSIVARKTGSYNADNNFTAVGIRCYYENIDELTDQIELHYVNETIPGYFWIFPAGGGTANIGVGLLKSKVKKKSKKLHEILNQVISSNNSKNDLKILDL